MRKKRGSRWGKENRKHGKLKELSNMEEHVAQELLLKENIFLY